MRRWERIVRQEAIKKKSRRRKMGGEEGGLGVTVSVKTTTEGKNHHIGTKKHEKEQELLASSVSSGS